MAPHSRGVAGVWGGARGWNADQFGRQLLLLLVRPAFAWVGNVVVIGWLVVGALLGPERAGIPVSSGLVVVLCQGRSASHTASRSGWAWWGRVTGVWLYVENCTVDASIF